MTKIPACPYNGIHSLRTLTIGEGEIMDQELENMMPEEQEPPHSRMEMEEALQKVNLLGFLQQQDGLQTQLLERAENLSGGQCQRLVIARALLMDAPVYIFDEATSNIDMESEELIMDVIHELAKTRTVLLISHRLANVVDSDRIYFLKEGRVCEQGTHEQLMEADGAYRKLYDSQKDLESWGDRQQETADEEKEKVHGKYA